MMIVRLRQYLMFQCTMLIPDLTRHTDVVEVIACAFLREKLSLEDEHIVQIVVK